ncbi:MAG: 4-phosphoerythronate dehydrogenase [Kiritimatiellia bacterium]
MSSNIRIVCSAGMPLAAEAFGTLGEVTVLEGRNISREDLKSADILAIRSTTRVDRALLEGTPVKFAGTATIGCDHMDTAYLHGSGIRWCHSPGCNANSVSEYVAAALLCLGRKFGRSLSGCTMGIIGVGNVGSLVADKVRALGMRLILNDPPRQRAGRTEGNENFTDLNTLLKESDIVSMHVPLTRDGTDATWHMADAGFFSRMKTNSFFLNSARGSVVETDSLLEAMSRGAPAAAVIDTWEGEPHIRRDLLETADVATPHIAGYSYDGKVNGTVMVYIQACKFLGVEPEWSPEPFLPEPAVPEIEITGKLPSAENGMARETFLREVVGRIYDIESDDRLLRESSAGNIGERFDRLRRNYPVRREFQFTRLLLPETDHPSALAAGALGFQVQAGGVEGD